MTERTPFVISTEKGGKPAEWRNLARLRIYEEHSPLSHAFTLFKGEGMNRAMF